MQNVIKIKRTKPVRSAYAPVKRTDPKRTRVAKAETLARRNIRAVKYATAMGV